MEKMFKINTIDGLASCLGVNRWKLDAIIDNIKGHYKSRIIVKNKKKRRIDMPDSDLKKIQRLINKRLLQKIYLPDTIQGSKKKGSIKKNAELHVGQKIIGNLDIKDFFPSVNRKRIKSVFIEIGCSSIVSDMLVKLTTWREVLPQGVPTSSSIANLILLNMDKRFKNLCEIHGLRYSFYVDDITVSGNQRVEKLKNLFCKIIGQEGFDVNPGKIKFRNRTERQLVTNLVINSGKPNVSKEYRRNLRAVINNCVKLGSATQTKKSIEEFKRSLIGKINYVLSINQRAGNKLLNEFQKINWAA